MVVGMSATSCGAAGPHEGSHPREPEHVHVEFVGNQGVDAGELSSAIRDERESLVDRGAGSINAPTMGAAREALLAALYDHGFLEAQIDVPATATRRNDETYDLQFTVREGSVYRFGRVQIAEFDDQGMEVVPLGGRETIRSIVTIRTGDPFVRRTLSHQLLALRTHYRDAGYAFADVPPAIDLHRDTGFADVSVRIARGPLAHVESIAVQGLQHVPEAIVLSHVRLHAGDLFNETALETSRVELQHLREFASVDMTTAPPIDRPDRVAITVVVHER